MTTTLLYRGGNAISKVIADMGKRDFGVEFRGVPWKDSQESVLARSGDSNTPMPKVPASKNDFWIVNATHLRTVWADNTFSMGTKKKDDFILNSGRRETVPMLVTELNSYRHAKTGNFEAIELDCNEAYLQIVLPRGDTSLGELETRLSKNDGEPPTSLKREIGDVEIPPFSFEFEADIRQALEKIGVRRIFQTTDSLAGLVDGPDGARLQGISQKVEIEVNEQGIRANAGTVANGVYGGIIGGWYVPFHMVVNRPFLFFIRDNVSGSLLFAGVIIDPAVH